tara:strand:+ start:489 stop:2003 length:1515 start_codon:yes stop_codon:yes gene_type:complete
VSQSVPKPRLAVVLHGKIGNERQRAKDGGLPSPGTIGLSAITAWQVLLEPLSARFDIDRFGHCWSPRHLAPLLSEVWNLTASHFETDRSASFESACNPAKKMVQRCAGGSCETVSEPQMRSFPGSCGRTMSQLLGMQRAIRLKARYEAAHGFRYDAVFVSRWDVVWWSSAAAKVLGDAAASQALQPRVWLQDMCAQERKRRQGADQQYMQEVCGTARQIHTLVPPSATSCADFRGCFFDLSPIARGFFVYDMWFLSSSALADDFATAYDSFATDQDTIKSEFWNAIGRNMSLGSYAGRWRHIFGHFFWGLHLFRRMKAAVAWAALELDRDLVIVRNAGAGIHSCDPTREQLLRGVRKAATLLVPPAFDASSTATAVPMDGPVRQLPVADSCRSNPAFREAPLGGGRSFRCPMASPACADAELSAQSSVPFRAARFYNVTSGIVGLERPRHKGSSAARGLVDCKVDSTNVLGQPAACARALRRLWECVRLQSAAECRERLIVRAG